MNKKPKQFDHILLFVVVALMGVGLVMVYSASSITSLAQMQDGLYYFKRQFMWVVIGLLAMLATSTIPYNKLEKLSVPLLGIAIFLLILVLIPGVARDIGGAKRWIRFGGIGLQPSEFAKICFVLYMAHSISSRQTVIKSFLHGMLPDLFVTALMFLLIYKEPNLSTATLIGGTYFTMYFLGNGSLANLGGLAAGGVVLVTVLDKYSGILKSFKHCAMFLFNPLGVLLASYTPNTVSPSSVNLLAIIKPISPDPNITHLFAGCFPNKLTKC